MDFIIKQGYSQSKVDYSLFTHTKCGTSFVTLLIYVDDIIIIGDNVEMINELNRKLDKEFKIKELGNQKYFLGIEVIRYKNRIDILSEKICIGFIKACRVFWRENLCSTNGTK